MYIYVYIYVYYIYIYICMYLYIYTHIYIYMYMCIYIYMWIYMLVYVHICICGYICLYVYTYVHICIHILVYLNVCRWVLYMRCHANCSRTLPKTGFSVTNTLVSAAVARRSTNSLMTKLLMSTVYALSTRIIARELPCTHHHVIDTSEHSLHWVVCCSVFGSVLHCVAVYCTTQFDTSEHPLPLDCPLDWLDGVLPCVG